MKLKSYNILFRLFSFLSDRTNGAPFFVKYKLLLGTILIGLISSPAKASKREIAGDSIPFRPIAAEISCYRVAVPKTDQNDSNVIEVKGNVKGQYGEAMIGVNVKIKNSSHIGVLTNLDGDFTLTANANDTLIFSSVGIETKEISAQEIRSNMSIEMQESLDEISCYVVVTSNEPPKEIVLGEIEIQGIVKDDNGDPMLGTGVGLKSDPQRGTVADVDGRFKLKVQKDDILVFSFIGYKRQEIPVSEISDGKGIIILEEDNMILCYDPVVVPYTYLDDIYRRSPKKIKKLAYDEVDTNPVSPVGGIKDFENWLQSNIQYSEQMKTDKLKGQVILGFAVDKKGRLVDKKVIAKLSKEADEEALRVLSLSDKWRAGKYDNKPMKTTMIVTVNFDAK